MKLIVSAIIFVFLAAMTAPALAAFTVTSSSIQDGAIADKAYGNNGNDAQGNPCGGQGISPQLSWSGAPPNTQSFAVTMFDPEGRGGLGVSHWVMYNIPATVTSVARGDGTGASAKYTQGKNQSGQLGYRGSCPGASDAPHHYTIEVYALDVPPTLPAGLDRAGFESAITGHTLGSSTGIIMKYSR